MFDTAHVRHGTCYKTLTSAGSRMAGSNGTNCLCVRNAGKMPSRPQRPDAALPSSVKSKTHGSPPSVLLLPVPPLLPETDDNNSSPAACMLQPDASNASDAALRVHPSIAIRLDTCRRGAVHSGVSAARVHTTGKAFDVTCRCSHHRSGLGAYSAKLKVQKLASAGTSRHSSMTTANLKQRSVQPTVHAFTSSARLTAARQTGAKQARTCLALSACVTK